MYVRRMIYMRGVWSECTAYGLNVRRMVSMCGVWSECVVYGLNVRCMIFFIRGLYMMYDFYFYVDKLTYTM